MRIAFITPNLYSLHPKWKLDPQLVKLPAPVVSGYLHACGYQDIRQYDFELEVFDLETNRPGTLDLRLFYDDRRVERFLDDDDEGVRAQTDLLCETLAIEEADLFGISCAITPLPTHPEIHATINVALCLVKALKRRFPGCRTVIGGALVTPESRKREEYRRMLERCRGLDFVVDGPGEAPMLHIVEHLIGKASFEANGQAIEPHGNGLVLLDHETLRRVPIRPVARPLPPPESAEETMQPIAGFVTPYFDPAMIEKRRVRGLDLLRRYRMSEERIASLARFHDRRVLPLPMMFIHGCNGRCAFCCYSLTEMVKRDIDEVIRSIAWLQETYQTRCFSFLNSNINGQYAFADRFCDALIAAKLDIRWSDSVRLGTLDERLLDKLRRSGLIRMVVGVECPSDKMMKYVHKGVTVAKAIDLLRRAHEHGIWTHAQFIAGMPHETEEDRMAFLDFIEKTSDYTNACNINRYYFDMNSVMAAEPARYGIIPRQNTSGCQEDAGFDEVGGLAWEDKKKEIVRSQNMMTKAVERLRGPQRWCLDLDLVFFLYECFGHEGKAEITRIHRDAFPGIEMEVEASPGEDAMEIHPDLTALAAFLRRRSPAESFGGFGILDTRLQTEKVYVTLRGQGESVTLLITQREANRRYFATAGRFAISHLIETPVNTPLKRQAVLAFAGEVGREFGPA